MAIPSFYTFKLLHVNAQIGLCVMEGTYLANRFGEEGDLVNLYHMGTFFAEVYYDPEMNFMHDCRSFTSRRLLEPYADLIELPEL